MHTEVTHPIIENRSYRTQPISVIELPAKHHDITLHDSTYLPKLTVMEIEALFIPATSAYT
ncbi:hypothetical protein SLEP1_g37684 [Rubroshorea leprosula]|uniref:Transposase n=1 Tax=Rubroshorea leprosula TaxID=152421 RepID=A0AAV5KVF2_9ROSI|nr:hypothetical protein SLEP1_g37684 [Rubroshorea leprosula]